MINSKNELKRKLIENKDGIKFKTIENELFKNNEITYIIKKEE